MPPPPVAYPDQPLGRGLRSLARILGAGFGTRIATITQSGFDTHDDQRDEHAALLPTLSGSLLAWQADLHARGLADRVLTVVSSEFGAGARTTTRSAPIMAPAGASWSSAITQTAESDRSSPASPTSTRTAT